MTYTLDGELGVAPPCREDAKVGRVLDVGTGTGVWAIEFGDLHPEADVGWPLCDNAFSYYSAHAP